MNNIELDTEGFLQALEALTREHKIEIGGSEDETALYPLCPCRAGPDYGYTISYRQFCDGSGVWTGLEWVKRW